MPWPVMLKMKLNGSVKTDKTFETNTPNRCPFCYKGLECKSRKSRNTGVTGKFGLGVQDETGQRLIVFCQENAEMLKLVLEKAKEPEIKLPTSGGSSKKQKFQKNIYFCFIDYAKALNVWITINYWKFWKILEYQTTWPAFWETCTQVKRQQLELYMEQQTGSK